MKKEIDRKMVSDGGEIVEVADDTSLATIHTLLKKHNMSVDKLIEVGVRGLSATKPVRNRYGEVVEDDPDNTVRNKYWTTLVTAAGMIKPVSVGVQVVNLTPQEKELIDAYKRNTIDTRNGGKG